MTDADDRVGLTAIHTRYVGQRDAFFLSGMIEGSFLMSLFGQVTAELCIRLDGDEGRLVGFSEVDFLAPVHPGDLIEVEGKLVRVGNTSREFHYEARVLCRSLAHVEDDPSVRSSAATVLDEPLVCARAIGTAVVPVEGRPKTPWPHTDGERRTGWGRRRRTEQVDPAAEIE